MPGFNIPQLSGGGCDDPSKFKGISAYEGPSSFEETARNHRFLFETIGGYDSLDPITFWAFKATRPTPEIDEIKIHSGQDEIYRPGKHRWKPIEISFYERLKSPVKNGSNEKEKEVNQVAQLIYKWWAGGSDLFGFSRGVLDLDGSPNAPDGVFTGRSRISGGASNYYRSVKLMMLNGVGDPVWSYFLADCWPISVTPSDLDYADTEIATISLTLRYNRAIENREF